MEPPGFISHGVIYIYIYLFIYIYIDPQVFTVPCILIWKRMLLKEDGWHMKGRAHARHCAMTWLILLEWHTVTVAYIAPHTSNNDVVFTYLHHSVVLDMRIPHQLLTLWIQNLPFPQHHDHEYIFTKLLFIFLQKFQVLEDDYLFLTLQDTMKTRWLTRCNIIIQPGWSITS